MLHVSHFRCAAEKKTPSDLKLSKEPRGNEKRKAELIG